MRRRTLLAPAVLVAGALALTGCVAKQQGGATGGSAARGVLVRASDTGCELSSRSVGSGTSTFTVTNTGSTVTEFYVLADRNRIIGEVENIGPGLTRTLSVQVQPGRYTTECKPGMTGTGVGTAAFTVTGRSVMLAGDSSDQAKAAAGRYAAYVRNEADELLAATTPFAADFAAGRARQARAEYAAARVHYERIEPVAESFGDLDPKLDARLPDVAKGTAWTGWHRIEHDLWNGGKVAPLTAAERRTEAAALVANTEQLVAAVRSAAFAPTADSIANGSIGLLDEVAKSKITGEEEAYSHTDLMDFAANVEGSQVAYEGVRDLAERSDPALVKEIDARYAALDALLGKYGSVQKGFVPYTDLKPADVRALAGSVNALAEPLSELTSAVLK